MFNKFVIPDVADGFITPAKKSVPYTITVIGGPEELKAWRKQQALEAEIRAVASAKAYAVRREIAIKMIEEQATTTLNFTDAEKKEMQLKNITQEGDFVGEEEYMPNGYTPQRVEKISNEIKPLETAKTPELILNDAPKTQTVWQKLKSLPGEIWRNAFDPLK